MILSILTLLSLPLAALAVRKAELKEPTMGKLLKFTPKAEREPKPEPQLEQVPYDDVFMIDANATPEEIAEGLAGMFSEEEIEAIREYFEGKANDESDS
jgi:hypothetical protein